MGWTSAIKSTLGHRAERLLGIDTSLSWLPSSCPVQALLQKPPLLWGLSLFDLQDHFLWNIFSDIENILSAFPAFLRLTRFTLHTAPRGGL